MKKGEQKYSDSLTSILGGDARFEGTLDLKGSLRIDGSFRGTLTCGGSVTIGGDGSFHGEIRAEEVILGGQITGRVLARKLMVLEATSKLEGELACGTLHVNEGAVFNGTSVMGERAVEELFNEPLKQLEASDVPVYDDESDDELDGEPVRDRTGNGFHFSDSESSSS